MITQRSLEDRIFQEKYDGGKGGSKGYTGTVTVGVGSTVEVVDGLIVSYTITLTSKPEEVQPE